MLVKIYSFFAVIHLTSSLNVEIPLQNYEFARGGNGTIPCSFKPQKADNPSIIISWTANPDNPQDSDIDILTYYYFANAENQLDVADGYTDRASLQLDIVKGWANLTLKSLTSRDSRVFQCEVKIPRDSAGKQSDTTMVVVLVAPSKPICAIQGTAEFYHNINLTCRSEEGTPTPTYKWQSYDGTNNPRQNPPKSTDVNGVLSLYNISADTSGYYICTSANKIRNSMKIGSTAGIIGGCAILLLLLIIVICCCIRRKKNKSEEYAMRSPEYADYTDKEPQEFEEHQVTSVESKADRRDERSDRSDDRQDRDDRQGRPDYRQYDSDRHDDRRSDRYDDRRSDRYDDRQSDRYDDRRSDRYDDRRSDRYDDRYGDRYDDRRSDRYDDRRSDRYDEPRDRYDDRHSDRYADRYDDRRDRYDHPDDRYDGRSRPPNVPANKPTRG
ncbi:hypothetical protein PDJAM_G00158280 [Pangasius djambal]|uniref:Uncharacterized protein n=1 Tax=Pangasius djambal TaxID=1691987 RepID=A0ACC5ZJ62_9TELE|nr:hypothetical protein [Pangasius djambal]